MAFQDDALAPLRSASLKEVFVARFEELILSGHFSIGQKLPSERILATQLGVSRPVVHEGLVELAARGLVSIQPRVGTVINDYHRQGSLALLNSLVAHSQVALSPAMLTSLLDLRRLIETETAELAARYATDADLDALDARLAALERAASEDSAVQAERDFALHHRLAVASANLMYPMLLKSCEVAYRHLSEPFFRRHDVLPVVSDGWRSILDRLRARDADGARAAMNQLLRHGRDVLQDVLSEVIA